jgi:AAA+ ATPase superfamily predicted ATPase
MRVVRRAVSATESQPTKSRRGFYQIADPFLRFWFRFVHPHRGALDIGLADAVLEQRVRPAFDQFVSYAFEEAAREYVARLARAGELPFLPERIGAWWGQGEEVDVVAVSDAEGAALVGECKWWTNPVGVNVLVDLRRKAQVLAASGRWTKVSYALFARAGFTPDLQTVAASEGVRLVHAAELVGGL